MVFGVPQVYVLGVGVMIVMLKTKTQESQNLIFSREIENQTPYLYGLNQVFSSLDRVSINLCLIIIV